MLPRSKLLVFTGLVACLFLPLTGCNNSSVGQAVQQSLEADPQLKDNPATLGIPSSSANLENSNLSREAIAADFQAKRIPLYPNAVLQSQQSIGNQSRLTRWTTPDSAERVQTFYQQALQANNWQIQLQDTQPGTLVAGQNELQVTVIIQPALVSSGSPSSSANTNLGTEFQVQYVGTDGETATGDSGATVEGAVGLAPESDLTTTATSENASIASNAAIEFKDLNQAPKELQQPIADLAQLGLLSVTATGAKAEQSSNNLFEPNKPITRAQYVRWLVTVNNRFYRDLPARQIRLAAETAQPTFRDVPRSHPDFPVIQGLAEAGIISSPISGDSSAVAFRPDAPLTRESLILWKVPLDIRQALPAANLDTAKQTWGFQDAARIDPQALRAVLADFQNGDMANIRRVFGYTTLFQPKKTVNRAEAAAALWYFGTQGEGLSAQDILTAERQNSQ